MTIHVSHLSKSFGTFGVLSNINLEVKTGELLALLGPSGSGKTTLLRVIAGLEQADSGEVIIDGVRANNMGIKERRVGFVFQHYALFKHMSVYDNVAFGLRVRPQDGRPGEEEIRERVMALLKLVHLDRFANRYPSQLSGGQRQRVALARSLAVEPKLLLLDEPFGALDSKVRKELRRWLRRLHEEVQITSIFVTHDQEEAMEVADRVVVMNHGKIEQIGTPEDVYHQPRSGFVYDFLGNYNEFAGWRDEQGNIHLAEDDLWEPPPPALQDERPLQTTAPQFLRRYPGIGGLIRKVIPKALDARWAPTARQHSKATLRSELAKRGVPVRVFARPHEMFVALQADGDGDYIPATVMHVNPAGALSKVELERADGTVLQAELPKHVLDELAIKKGKAVFVKPKNVRVFE